MDFPFTYEAFDEETNTAIRRDFPTLTSGLGTIQPAGCVMCPEFMELARSIYNMQVKDDDLWVVTYPKTGTTWMQNIVSQVMTQKKQSVRHVMDRWTFLEFQGIIPNNKEQTLKYVKEKQKSSKDEIQGTDSNVGDHFMNQFSAFESCQDAVSPRFLKSHLPMSMLPGDALKRSKVIYVARNAADTCVSYYHHQKHINTHDFQGDFKQFFQYFIKDQVIYSSYWAHVKEAWSLRHEPNLLFMFYEDMKEDLSGSIKKVGSFLGKEFSDARIEEIRQLTTFDGMKKTDTANGHEEMAQKIGVFKEDGSAFLRKGQSGGWSSYFTEEMKEEMKAWSKKQREDSDIVFKNDLN